MPIPTFTPSTPPPVADLLGVLNGTIWPEIFKFAGWMAAGAVVISLVKRLTAK